MDARTIDRLDRCFSVGIRRQQRTLGLRVKLLYFLQQGHTGHARHSLVGDNQGHGISALMQLLACVQRRRA